MSIVKFSHSIFKTKNPKYMQNIIKTFHCMENYISNIPIIYKSIHTQ